MAKILVVDDERHIVRLMQVNLERAGYEVMTAFDGAEALKRVWEEKPDLIVLDTMMPKMDGFEILMHLKANPETRDLPVIMLIARMKDEEVFRSWLSGVDELLLLVKRILDSGDDGPFAQVLECAWRDNR